MDCWDRPISSCVASLICEDVHLSRMQESCTNFDDVHRDTRLRVRW